MAHFSLAPFAPNSWLLPPVPAVPLGPFLSHWAGRTYRLLELFLLHQLFSPSLSSFAQGLGTSGLPEVFAGLPTPTPPPPVAAGIDTGLGGLECLTTFWLVFMALVPTAEWNLAASGEASQTSPFLVNLTRAPDGGGLRGTHLCQDVSVSPVGLDGGE